MIDYFPMPPSKTVLSLRREAKKLQEAKKVLERRAKSAVEEAAEREKLSAQVALLRQEAMALKRAEADARGARLAAAELANPYPTLMPTRVKKEQDFDDEDFDFEDELADELADLDLEDEEEEEEQSLASQQRDQKFKLAAANAEKQAAARKGAAKAAPEPLLGEAFGKAAWLQFLCDYRTQNEDKTFRMQVRGAAAAWKRKKAAARAMLQGKPEALKSDAVRKGVINTIVDAEQLVAAQRAPAEARDAVRRKIAELSPEMVEAVKQDKAALAKFEALRKQSTYENFTAQYNQEEQDLLQLESDIQSNVRELIRLARSAFREISYTEQEADQYLSDFVNNTLRVFLAPDQCDTAPEFDPEQVKDVLRILTAQYPAIPRLLKNIVELQRGVRSPTGLVNLLCQKSWEEAVRMLQDPLYLSVKEEDT